MMQQEDLAALLGFSPGWMMEKLTTIGALVENRWKYEATVNLPDVSAATRMAYIGAIRMVVEGDTVRVEMRDLLGNIIEQGIGPGGIGTQGAYDLRAFILKAGTRNLHSGPKGLWVNVPFKSTDGQIGAALLGWKGRAMDRKNERAGTHHVEISGPSSRASYPISPADAMRIDTHMHSIRALSGQNRLPAGMAPKLASHHATDPLAGLRRESFQHTQGGPVQHQNITFRRITSWGKPWMSPGFQARRIANIVQDAVPGLVAQVPMFV